MKRRERPGIDVVGLLLWAIPVAAAVAMAALMIAPVWDMTAWLK